MAGFSMRNRPVAPLPSLFVRVGLLLLLLACSVVQGQDGGPNGGNAGDGPGGTAAFQTDAPSTPLPTEAPTTSAPGGLQGPISTFAEPPQGPLYHYWCSINSFTSVASLTNDTVRNQLATAAELSDEQVVDIVFHAILNTDGEPGAPAPMSPTGAQIDFQIINATFTEEELNLRFQAAFVGAGILGTNNYKPSSFTYTHAPTPQPPTPEPTPLPTAAPTTLEPTLEPTTTTTTESPLASTAVPAIVLVSSTIAPTSTAVLPSATEAPSLTTAIPTSASSSPTQTTTAPTVLLTPTIAPSLETEQPTTTAAPTPLHTTEAPSNGTVAPTTSPNYTTVPSTDTTTPAPTDTPTPAQTHAPTAAPTSLRWHNFSMTFSSDIDAVGSRKLELARALAVLMLNYTGDISGIVQVTGDTGSAGTDGDGLLVLSVSDGDAFLKLLALDAGSTVARWAVSAAGNQTPSIMSERLSAALQGSAPNSSATTVDAIDVLTELGALSTTLSIEGVPFTSAPNTPATSAPVASTTAALTATTTPTPVPAGTTAAATAGPTPQISGTNAPSATAVPPTEVPTTGAPLPTPTPTSHPSTALPATSTPIPSVAARASGSSSLAVGLGIAAACLVLGGVAGACVYRRLHRRKDRDLTPYATVGGGAEGSPSAAGAGCSGRKLQPGEEDGQPTEMEFVDLAALQPEPLGAEAHAEAMRHPTTYPRPLGRHTTVITIDSSVPVTVHTTVTPATAPQAPVVGTPVSPSENGIQLAAGAAGKAPPQSGPSPAIGNVSAVAAVEPLDDGRYSPVEQPASTSLFALQHAQVVEEPLSPASAPLTLFEQQRSAPPPTDVMASLFGSAERPNPTPPPAASPSFSAPDAAFPRVVTPAPAVPKSPTPTEAPAEHPKDSPVANGDLLDLLFS